MESRQTKRKVGTIKVAKTNPSPMPLYDIYKSNYQHIQHSIQLTNNKTTNMLSHLEGIVESLIRKNDLLNYERNILIEENIFLKSSRETYELSNHSSVSCSQVSQLFKPQDQIRPPSKFKCKKITSMMPLTALEVNKQLLTLNNIASRQNIFLNQSEGFLSLNGLTTYRNVKSPDAYPHSHLESIVHIDGVQSKKSIFYAEDVTNPIPSPHHSIQSIHPCQNVSQFNSAKASQDHKDNMSFQLENNAKTPTLNHNKQSALQNWIETVRCPKQPMYSPLRCFYLCMLTAQKLRTYFLQILQELKANHEGLMIGLYQNNQLWVHIAEKFIAQFLEGHITQPPLRSLINHSTRLQTLISYLNNNQLVDMTMIAILRQRLHFIFDNDTRPSPTQQFQALANAFNVLFAKNQNTYQFYQLQQYSEQSKQSCLLNESQLLQSRTNSKRNQEKLLFKICQVEGANYYQFQIHYSLIEWAKGYSSCNQSQSSYPQGQYSFENHQDNNVDEPLQLRTQLNQTGKERFNFKQISQNTNQESQKTKYIYIKHNNKQVKSAKDQNMCNSLLIMDENRNQLNNASNQKCLL